MVRGSVARVAFSLGLLWAAAILLAPRAIAAPGVLPHAIAVAAAATYVGGHVVCHQRPERSFALAGQPMPVCARCAGLYVAFPIAFLLCRRLSPGSERLRSWLLICAAPTVLTVGVEAATGVTTAPARALAGAMLGIGLARLLAAALAEGAPARSMRSATLAG